MKVKKWKWSHSVVSDSSRPHGLQPTRLLRLWDFPGKSTGLGCHCLLWTNLTRQHIKKQRRYFASKGLSSQSYGFSSGHVWMWELDHKEGWASENWCFRTMVLSNYGGLLRVPWTAKRSNQSILKKINPAYSLEGLMLKLKLQYRDHLMRRVNIGKDSDAGKDWRQKEKGDAEVEMVRQHHRLNGHEFEQPPGDSEGQGSLACCSP